MHSMKNLYRFNHYFFCFSGGYAGATPGYSKNNPSDYRYETRPFYSRKDFGQARPRSFPSPGMGIFSILTAAKK